MSVTYTSTLQMHPKSGSQSPSKPKITQRMRHNSSPNLHSRASRLESRAKSPPKENGVRSYHPSLTNHSGHANHAPAKQHSVTDATFSDHRAARERRAESIEAQFRKAYSSSTTDVGVQYAPPRQSVPNVAAYVLQPNGTMATVRWDDKTALKTNKPVFEALKLEQQAQCHGKTTGRIQSASRNPRERLSKDMLEWLAGDGRGLDLPRPDKYAVREETIMQTRNSASNSSPMLVNLRSRVLSTPAAPQHSKPVPYHPRSKSTSALNAHSNSRASPSKQIALSHSQIIRSSGADGSRNPSTSRATAREPASSTQVQQTYWRPSTPDPSSPPARSLTTAHYINPSSQMSCHDFICTSPVPQGLPTSISPDRDTNSKNMYDANQNVKVEPVWKHFRFYEHCATSDL